MSAATHSWIDPHVHLFGLQEGDYHWLKPNNPPFWPDKDVIAESTYEHHLRRASKGKLTGFVHIEAGFDNERPWREIDFLMRHCSLPFRSIASIDLTSMCAGSHIDMLKNCGSVCGLRHILDENAHALLTSPKVKWALGHMAAKGLSFEAQFNLADRSAVKALLAILETYPKLRVAINHSAVAPVELNSLAFKHWQQNIHNLSETKQVAFKFSGLEMQNRNWQWQRAQPLFNSLVNTVGVAQLMLASNYPLCQWRMPYEALWQGFLNMTAPLCEHQKAALFSLNAKQWYGLA